ncbi:MULTISPECIES: hypothetical protein [unclassified Neglectibacter]|uniref:hypothetical protein n=2 Tax=Eubacteriales TaxID=186802 RepID=UPI001411F535|nr:MULTISPECIES: hypothetical protein [unclassified Neglectibacter]
MNPFSTEVEAISMDGFQVVSGEYFSHFNRSVTPSCTIWNGGITFNKASLTALNNCERIRVEINARKMCLLAVPVTAKDRDAIVWRKNVKEYVPRRMESIRFSSRIYEMWGWDPDFTYRAPGRLVTVDSKVMLLYDFSSPEQWESKGKTR